jgi:hypothetical protein
MTEVSESIIRKIEKCLALSKSSNEHEAAAALRQATKLMEAYNVTPEALAGAKIGETEADTDAWTRPPMWEIHLLNTIRVAFGCECILRLGNSQVKRLTKVVYIGVKPQAQLAAYAHAVLRRQVDKARSKYTTELGTYYTRGEKIAKGEAFCVGYIANIKKQVTALAVPADQAAAIDAFKGKLLTGPRKDYKPSGAGRGLDASAYHAGVSAGAGASLHRPMNGGASHLQLS